MIGRVLAAVGLCVVIAVLTPFILKHHWNPLFDRQAWVEDFDALKAGMERQYANLTWAASPGSGVDVPKLERDARAALEAARTDGQARQAIERFLRGFKDGHIVPGGVARALGEDVVRQPFAADLSADEACQALFPGGSVPAYSTFSLPVELVAAADLVTDGEAQPFRTALLTLADGRRLGIIRIPSFFPKHYPAACREVWEAARPPAGAPCDAPCQRKFQGRILERMTVLLGQRVAALREKGAQALIVDVGGNPGGTIWYMPAAHQLTPRMIAGRPMLLVRDDSAAKFADSLEKRVDALLTNATLPVAARASLREAQTTIRTFKSNLAAGGCDLSWVWREARVWDHTGAAGCGNLAAGLFTTGTAPLLEPGSLNAMEVERLIYFPASIPRRGAPWLGPMVVLVDGRSASAAEAFAFGLREAGVARIVGRRTAGAGCGYVGTWNNVTLPRSGDIFSFPNSACRLPDGRNAIVGVDPDVTLEGDLGARARTLLDVAGEGLAGS